MSRTYRRKSGSDQDNWKQYDYICPKELSTVVKVRLKGEALAKANSMYHSDSTATMQQVPKWYKTIFLRRPFRRKQKATLDRALRNMEYDVVMPIDKKRALYYW